MTNICRIWDWPDKILCTCISVQMFRGFDVEVWQRLTMAQSWWHRALMRSCWEERMRVLFCSRRGRLTSTLSSTSQSLSWSYKKKNIIINFLNDFKKILWWQLLKVRCYLVHILYIIKISFFTSSVGNHINKLKTTTTCTCKYMYRY